MIPSCELELTFRGIDIDENLIHYARRCAGKLPGSDLPGRMLRVLVERADRSHHVRAWVAIEAGSDAVRGRGRDIDPWLAIKNAFASLETRLGPAPSCAGAVARLRDRRLRRAAFDRN